MGKRMKLERRTFLKGAGAAIALPSLEAMGGDKALSAIKPRLLFIYVPLGVDVKQWHPLQQGPEYTLTSSLEPLNPLKKDVTVLTGLEHIEGKLGAHYTLDNFITGANIWKVRGAYRNTISADQLAAKYLCGDCYVDSLALSGCEGIGRPGLSHTLSYNSHGQPVPALSKPREIFRMLFPPNNNDDRTALKRRFQGDVSILDLVKDNTVALNGKLGVADKQRLDEYLSSVRDLERNIQTKKKTLDFFSNKSMSNDPFDHGEDLPPGDFIDVMFRLILLAFQNEMTRTATYAFCSENGTSPFRLRGAELITGRKVGDWHPIAHTNMAVLGEINRWFVERFRMLLEQMKNIPVGEGNLLDYTPVTMGWGQSEHHNPRNLPILTAGGTKLGLRHGQHLKFQRGATPVSNLLLTLLQQTGVPVEKFSESTGTIVQLTT